MTDKKTVEHNRSAVSGRFVTEHYAKTHPRTTVTEHRPAPKPPHGGKSKK